MRKHTTLQCFSFRMTKGAPDKVREVHFSNVSHATHQRTTHVPIHAAPLTGPFKATEAADAWAKVLDCMEEAWMASSRGDNVGANSTAPVPPLRVFMRLGALYTTLGRMEEAKVRSTHLYWPFWRAWHKS